MIALRTTEPNDVRATATPEQREFTSTTTEAFTMLDSALRIWLESQADPLDQGLLDSESLLPQLADSGVLGHGVPSEFGGIG